MCMNIVVIIRSTSW